VEFLLLRRSLDRRIGAARLDRGLLARMWTAAILAAAAGFALWRWTETRLGPVGTALAVLLPFGGLYLGGTLVLRVPMARDTARRWLRRG
jgi:putative peptidoglycan lipid II flippase